MINLELKKKIGQMFMCGFDSLEINDHAKNLIDNYYLGNIILFSRNLDDEKQVVKLNSDLKDRIKHKTNYEPFISIDEEGGSVSRLRYINGEFLGHYAIGSLKDSSISFDIGNYVGKKINDLGINMNLAPVADINSNPENIGIGIRSFGDNKELVKTLSTTMYKGYEESNILPVLKHFPGLGDVAVDSHHDLPILKKSLEEIKSQELVPFTYGIENGIKAIMVSHIIFDCIDKKYPASMSKAVITDLLQNELGFDGIVMTDCFEMGAIQKNYGTSEAVIIALNAGIDIFDISHTENLQVEAIEGVYKAVEEGIITEERINKSYEKIIKFKENLKRAISTPKEVSLEKVYKKVLDTNNIDKINLDKNKTIAFAVNQFSSNPAEDIIEKPTNIADIFENITGIKTIGFNNDVASSEIDKFVEIALNQSKSYENVILFLGDMDIYKNQHELYNKLEPKNVYLIDMRLKVNKLKYEPKLKFNAYSYTNETVKILCNYLQERIDEGKK